MPENMIVNEGMSDEVMAEVIDYVGDESRLEGGSLVAANAGWCAPLETIWDICEGGTTEGLWDIPEMRVNRGGVRHMPASDFSDLYAANTTPGTTAAGWYYTEAQVQADTAKVCIDVPCPTWDEIVLDAAGICVTSSLLTNVAHPEWVRAFVSEAMIAHQVLVQKKLLTDAVAGATAFAATDTHSTTGSTLAAIELIVSNLRQTHRWSMNTSLEAVFPHWVRGAIRADLSMRNGVNLLAVTDAEINAWFALRGVRPQFVYGLSDLPAGAVVYPATFTALFYKAGTFVKGTTPVINLSTLYDSSLLSVNKAQQLFFEEGVLMLERCYGATAATIPVNNSGATAGQLVEALTAEDLTA
jgi:hypothetical protein